MKKHLKKILGVGIGGFIVLGMVNAFIIGHQSEISGDITYIKGLDEMYGHSQPGRVLATNSGWKKIEEDKEILVVDNSPITKLQGEAPAIGEDLQLDLVEVINPKIWSKGLPNTQFSGELQTANGTIESLTVSLPGKEEISISFAEMNGNVFQYDYAGEVYSGMLYQVDPKSYMVTLTNGPLEGTRMRFVQDYSPEQVEIKETLKEEHNIEVGFFGENPKQAPTPKKQSSANVEVQMINMDAQV